MAKKVHPLPSVEAASEVHPLPSVEAASEVHPLPSVEAASEVHPLPSVEAASEVHPLPSVEAASEVHPLPSVEAASEVHPLPSVEAASEVHPLPSVEAASEVHPLPSVEAASVSSHVSSKRETFTVWMKSLVMQGNGCTVYGESGEVVYRIDNYDSKKGGGSEVYLMDLRGNVLFTILRKLCFFGHYWKGYEGDTGSDDCLNSNSNKKKKKPVFEVSKRSGIRGKTNSYKLQVLDGKDYLFRITQQSERDEAAVVVVAEGRRKRSRGGVFLGDAVFSLVVEPRVDQSFVMALVTVFGLIHHKL